MSPGPNYLSASLNSLQQFNRLLCETVLFASVWCEQVDFDRITGEKKVSWNVNGVHPFGLCTWHLGWVSVKAPLCSSSQVSTTSQAGCTWIHPPGSDDSLIRCVWFITSPSWLSQSLSSPLECNVEDAIARERIITLLINRLICIINVLILLV